MNGWLGWADVMGTGKAWGYGTCNLRRLCLYLCKKRKHLDLCVEDGYLIAICMQACNAL